MVDMTALKQFLKPDWRKIVITIILSILIFYIYYLSWLSTSAVIGISSEAWCCQRSEAPLEGCEEYTLEVCNRIEQEIFIKQSIFYLIVVIINYFFSCLIAWTYYKFRKKKKLKYNNQKGFKFQIRINKLWNFKF